MWILINICSDPSLPWERLIILHHNFSCGIQRLRRKMLAAHSNFPFVGSGWELKISRMRFVHDERSENVCGEQCFCYSSLEQMSYLWLCKMSWWRLVMVYAAQLRVLMGILDAVKWKTANVFKETSAFGGTPDNAHCAFKSSDILSFVTVVVPPLLPKPISAKT